MALSKRADYHSLVSQLPTRVVRCAIYTRKSTTEGLDSDFNTLDAQRDACEAYIRSQRTEGWLPLTERYDDGGFTGGNIDRPALSRLLADIQSGHVNCVVVYKVDRLSRSLLDFARLMADFEAHQVSFVSVTQQFNTATSMGRLVLNVLLSFAQFEREIISERTSDKMCAARRKGKWVGGPPVLGYDIDRERKRLVLNPEEAVIIRGLFRLYLEKKSMLLVAQEANRRGWKTKSLLTKGGRLRQGLRFDKAKLQRILANVTYTGQVLHKGEILPGEHSPIIDSPVFEKVQKLVKANFRVGTKPTVHFYDALLKKLLRCGNCGAIMAHTYGKKKNRLYHYYVCTTKEKQGREVCDTRRLPAQEIEDCVAQLIMRIGQDPKLTEQAFRESVKQREAQKTSLVKEKRQLLLDQQQAEERIKKLVAAIDSSATPLASIAEQLLREEELVSQQQRRSAEIDGQLSRLELEKVDKEQLVDTLSRLGSLWSTLAERERTDLLHRLLEAIIYDPVNGEISLKFRAGKPKQVPQER